MNQPKTSLCRACQPRLRLSESERQRILAEYLAEHPQPLVANEEFERRIGICRDCPSLLAGITCSKCGCLVQIRAKLARQRCPLPSPNW